MRVRNAGDALAKMAREQRPDLFDERGNPLKGSAEPQAQARPPQGAGPRADGAPPPPFAFPVPCSLAFRQSLGAGPFPKANQTERDFHARHLAPRMERGELGLVLFEALTFNLAPGLERWELLPADLQAPAREIAKKAQGKKDKLPAVRYTPDWIAAGECLEVYEIKGGHVRDDARAKFKIAAAMFPCFAWFFCERAKRGEPWTVTRHDALGRAAA